MDSEGATVIKEGTLCLIVAVPGIADPDRIIGRTCTVTGPPFTPCDPRIPEWALFYPTDLQLPGGMTAVYSKALRPLSDPEADLEETFFGPAKVTIEQFFGNG